MASQEACFAAETQGLLPLDLVAAAPGGVVGRVANAPQGTGEPARTLDPGVSPDTMPIYITDKENN